jgi:hypothetical protein
MRQPITEALVSCRNILVEGRVNEHVLPSLNEVLNHIESIEVYSTRAIIRQCTKEAIKQIINNELVSAGRIVNLIHNLPMTEQAEAEWSLDYFFSIELAAFLEYFEEIKSARDIVLYVCSHLASKYLVERA